MIVFVVGLSLILDVFVIYVVLKRLAIPSFVSKILTFLFVICNIIIILGLFVTSSAIIQNLAFFASIINVFYIIMATILMWIWPSKKFYFPILIIFTILAGLDVFLKIIIGIDIYILKSFSMAKKFLPSGSDKSNDKVDDKSKGLLDSGKQLFDKNKESAEKLKKNLPFG